MSLLPRLSLFFLFFLLYLSFLISPSPAHGISIPDVFPVFKFGGPTGEGGIGQLVSVLLSNIYVLAGIAFLFMLVISGLMYVFGAGSEDPKKIQSAQQTMFWTLVGLAVIIASYWIIQVIEALTGVTIF